MGSRIGTFRCLRHEYLALLDTCTSYNKTMWITVILLPLCLAVVQGLDILGFIDNFKKIREQSKSRRVMREVADCGKRWEGWRFAPRYDPSFGFGYHSCLWDCEWRENPLYTYPFSGKRSFNKIRKSISTILADIPDDAQLLLMAHSLEKDFADIVGMTDTKFNDKTNIWSKRKITYEITTPMIPKDL